MNRCIVKFICCYTMTIALGTSMLIAGHAWASDTASEYTPEDCIACHRTDSDESERQISIDEFEASVHGAELTCLDCHTDVIDDDHQTTEGSGAVDCNSCHEQENQHGSNGVGDQRPECYGCHMRHHILTQSDPASSVHPDQLTTTCAGCHASACEEPGFFAWFPAFQIASHNKADFGSAYAKNNCLGCHQGAAAHGESEPIDAQDCYKCHRDAQADSAMWGVMHPTADSSTQPTIFAAASVYQVFVVIGLIFVLRKLLNFIFDRPVGKSNP